MRKLANSIARDIASPAVKMGNKSLFPVVAVPPAFFCTLFFRHRQKSVSAPWDGKSQSAPELARHAPLGQGVCACGLTKRLSARPLETFGHRRWQETRRRQVPFPRQSWRTPTQAGGFPLAPCTPSDRSYRNIQPFFEINTDKHQGKIGTFHTAVRAADCPSELLRVLPPPLPRIDFPRSQITLPAPERKGTPHALFRRW